MNIKEFLHDHTLFLDGGMGTLLQARGLPPGELPERWSITHPEEVLAIHRAYYAAGSHVVSTNTFGANLLKFAPEELDEIVTASVTLARRAAETTPGEGPRFVALDIGPSGRMLRPWGDLPFEDAVSLFAATVRAGVRAGVDLIFIETMSDSYETKAALLAARENSDLPVFVSNAYGEDGKLMTGATPAAMVALLEGAGADAIGVNCSLGPAALRSVVEEYLAHASVPVLVKPNAGLPHVENGKTVYDVDPCTFAAEMGERIRLGVHAVGGCCGTTPEYIAATVAASAAIKVKEIAKKEETVISSHTRVLSFENGPVLIGERINPTGKRRLKEALRAADYDYLLREALAEEEAGAAALDVNVGLPEIDEPTVLREAVLRIQAVTSLPLQIDTADPVAMESALRVYNGKPLLNSVNGKRESMERIFPLAKKYGGVVVALTLDDGGIPPTAEGRLLIARRILSVAATYGIEKKDILFDPLAMAVSADPRAAIETLRAVALIKEELGCHTSLGVSNVSFGLPARDTVNASFFALALGRGLSAAIMNPHSVDMMKTYHAFRALSAFDENCTDYIAFAAKLPIGPVAAAQPALAVPVEGESPARSPLFDAIRRGLAGEAARLTEEEAPRRDPLAIINEEIIPALDAIGIGFEQKTVYLPELLMSAEAAAAAFEVIRRRMPAEGDAGKCAFVIATVRGDIHDIGKNIVKLLLENYGFAVTDLGRDVKPEEVVRAVVSLRAPLVGLSALMTTTVPAMEETVRALRAEAPWCKIVVGGAVLTAEYAAAIGADHYAKDAMATVRYAEEIAATL